MSARARERESERKKGREREREQGLETVPPECEKLEQLKRAKEYLRHIPSTPTLNTKP